MTLQELSQYYRLYERIEKNERILKSLEDAACPGAQNLTGMPSTTGVKDKVGDLAIEIADMQARIDELRKEAMEAEEQVSALIETIEDDQTRTIFRLRFLRCLTWKEVAAVIGGGNTERTVKNVCYRYIKS